MNKSIKKFLNLFLFLVLFTAGTTYASACETCNGGDDPREESSNDSEDDDDWSWPFIFVGWL